MAEEAMGPTVTVHLRLAKFDGEYAPGKEPVEVVETAETMPLPEWMDRQARQGGSAHA